MPLTTWGIRRMWVLKSIKHLLYSSMASLPNEKNATKRKVEIGVSHHEALKARSIIGGVKRAGYWSTRKKSEWTCSQFVQGRKGRFRMVNQSVYIVMARDQNIWKADMAISRKYRDVVRAELQELRCAANVRRLAKKCRSASAKRERKKMSPPRKSKKLTSKNKSSQRY